ncbi:MAG TPA: hypothetical protein VGK73_17220 [Polyangiaceae bacterium]
MTRPLLTRRLAPFAFCILAFPSLLRAQSSDIQSAKRLFSEAMVLEETGAWSQAAEKLREALAIKETPGLRYHLAHCEEQMGALVAASLDYARAAELIRGGAKAPDVQQLLTLAIQRMLTRVPKLTLVAPPGLEELAVAVDGNAVDAAVLGQATPIDPGRHRVTASARGRHDFVSDIEVRAGENRTLELVLPSEAAPVAPAPEAASEVIRSAPTAPDAPNARKSSFGAREATLVAEGALTLAGLGLGIGYAVVRANASADIARLQPLVDEESQGTEDPCAPGAPRSPNCEALTAAGERHRTASTLATVGFVGAGVGAAALALTWVLWPSSRKAVAIDVAPHASGLEVRAVTRF